MSNKKRIVEVFTAGCPVCEHAVQLVKQIACASCEVIIYDLNAGCETNECRKEAAEYGITRLPAVVVDGKPADCSKTPLISEETLWSAGVGLSI